MLWPPFTFAINPFFSGGGGGVGEVGGGRGGGSVVDARIFSPFPFPFRALSSVLVFFRKRLKQGWFTDLMLKKRVAALDAEVKSEYVLASKKAVMDYLLLDQQERSRLNIKVCRREIAFLGRRSKEIFIF